MAESEKTSESSEEVSSVKCSVNNSIIWPPTERLNQLDACISYLGF